VIHHAANIARAHNTVESLAIMLNMLCIAFFLHCRPGDYTAPTITGLAFDVHVGSEFTKVAIVSVRGRIK
jgi:hypothetical protein